MSGPAQSILFATRNMIRIFLSVFRSCIRRLGGISLCASVVSSSLMELFISALQRFHPTGPPRTLLVSLFAMQPSLASESQPFDQCLEPSIRPQRIPPGVHLQPENATRFQRNRLVEITKGLVKPVQSRVD